MEALAYIEILDRHGRVKERRPVLEMPFSIGRGYSNDIVLDDEYISAEHVKIDKVEHNILVIDNSSDNGVYQIGNRGNQKKIESSVVEDEIIIRIGHTRIRVRKTPFSIKKTKIDRAKIPIIGEMLDNTLGIFAVFSLAIAYFLLIVYVPDYSENSISETFTEVVLPACFILMVWAGIWSIASAIVFHENYFLIHLAIVSLFLIISGLVDWLNNLLMFNWPQSTLLSYLIWICYTVVLVALLYTHLRYTTIRSRTKTFIGAGGVALLIMLMSSGVIYVTEDRFKMNPSYDDTYLPSIFQMSSRIAMDDLELLIQTAKPGDAHRQ